MNNAFCNLYVNHVNYINLSYTWPISHNYYHRKRCEYGTLKGGRITWQSRVIWKSLCFTTKDPYHMVFPCDMKSVMFTTNDPYHHGFWSSDVTSRLFQIAKTLSRLLCFKLQIHAHTFEFFKLFTFKLFTSYPLTLINIFQPCFLWADH